MPGPQQREDQRMDFLAAATAMTLERAEREGWTQDDLRAARLQASLLLYRSEDDDSAPEMFTHNSPWNDWTPPSESRRIFEEAASAPRIEDGVSRRVRVRILPQTETGTKETIVFATLDVKKAGQEEVIVFRRGATELASLIKRKIRMTPHPNDPRLHVLTTRSRNSDAPLIVLRFEDARRREVFARMLAAQ